MSFKYFVIIGTMRSGSNFLEQQLAESEEVATYGEAFNPAFMGGPRHDTLAGWTVEGRDRDPLGFLSVLIDDAAPRIPGFRLFDGHSQPVLNHVLEDPDGAVIVLRRDPAESFVSLKIAEATGQWLLKSPRRRKRARILFDPEAYDRYSRSLEAFYRNVDARLARVGKTAFRIDYDSLSSRSAILKLAEFLGFEATSAISAPEIIRQNPEPLQDKVSNPQEMLAHLRRLPETSGAPDLQPASWVSSRHLEVAWARMPGQAEILGLAVLDTLEALSEVRNIRPNQALRRKKVDLFDVSEQVPEDGTSLSFLIIEPTELRLHELFLAHAFRGPRALHFVVSELDEMCGRVQPLNNWMQNLMGDDRIAAHRDRFKAFLNLVDRTRRGGGVHPMHEGWYQQADYVTAASNRFEAMLSMHGERLKEDLTELTEHLSLPGPSRAAIERLDAITQSSRDLFEKIKTDEILDLIGRLERGLG